MHPSVLPEIGRFALARSARNAPAGSATTELLHGVALTADPLVPASTVATMLMSRGDDVDYVIGDSYRDASTVIVCPTRGNIPARVAMSWLHLMGPMNQKKIWQLAQGHEVGRAYDDTIRAILAHPELSTWKYVLTLEDDNLPPPDAHIRLLETMHHGGWDGVGGIYFVKGPQRLPMAYGDPEHYRRTGQLDFRPRDHVAALRKGHVMPVNGIAMGCSLYKMDLFRQVEPPYYVTVSDIVQGKGASGFTQDLYFCEKADRLGKRFAVDMRVRVGHLDPSTGIVW